MYRATVAILALVAFAQVIEGLAFDTTHFVDIVAQKLEDHLRGVHLEDRITYDDCKAAVDEFEQWDDDTHNHNILYGPLRMARNYMDDFLVPTMKKNSDKYKRDEKLFNEFIEQLENTYEKARPFYTYHQHLQCDAGATITPKTCALVASLAGKGDPLTTEMIVDSYFELEALEKRVSAEREDVFENVQEFLDSLKSYNTPEVFVCQWPIIQLLNEDGSPDKLKAADPDEIQKYKDTYKNELAKFADSE